MKRVTARLATIPSYRLARRVALITGAGRGIGREIALAYAAEGADLVLVARSANELDLVVGQATELGIRAIAVPADVTVEADVHRLVERGLGEYERIDVLVNNAGITPGAAAGPIRTILDVSTEFWDRIFSVNCRGPFLLMREVLPGMLARGGGVILNITSRLSNRRVAGNAPYGPSKAALELLTLIVDAEFGPRGIRANLLHPGGPVATTIFNEYYQPPASELASPDVIRGAAVWLASDEAADVHGEVIDARHWNAEHGIASTDSQPA
jgi:NAD(P)-dependent dehydrogenase (short-subunit alcohol dehydrogenase family)